MNVEGYPHDTDAEEALLGAAPVVVLGQPVDDELGKPFDHTWGMRATTGWTFD
jgi:hypothetical protein